MEPPALPRTFEHVLVPKRCDRFKILVVDQLVCVCFEAQYLSFINKELAKWDKLLPDLN